MTLKRLCTIYTWRERQRGHQCWHSLPDTEEGEVVLWKNQVFQLSRKQTRTTAAAAGKAFKAWKASVSFTSTVVPTFPPVVAAFYENSYSPTTGLLYNTCVSRVVSRGRSCFASWSSSSSSFAEDLLALVLTRSRRVCRKKGEKKDAIWPNGTWYSLLMKPPWRKNESESIQQVSRLPGCSQAIPQDTLSE